MRFLYTIGVRLYGLAIRIASLFNPKAKKWIKGRKNVFNKFPTIEGKKVVWFHCASLGEFDQGLPLMEMLKMENPNVFLLVTFFSPSGFEHYEKRSHSADYVTYLPLDTPKNARKFVRHFNPSEVFFVKYEFWANYITEAKNSGAKLFNISGIFRSNHRFFKWYGTFFRNILLKFDHFFVQNKASQKLLSSINIFNVTTAGDSRFDRVIANSKSAEDNDIIAKFKKKKPLIIIGSSWPEDESRIIPWINENKTHYKVLIAPHQIDDKHINQITNQLTREFAKYTDSSIKDFSKYDVLILNTIGQLASAYKYGDIAYVGGGFSGSLHNILEPAVFGLPVLFGPKHVRFPEAQQFINEGFGFSINTKDEFEQYIIDIQSNYSVISEKERKFVHHNAGASKRILEEIRANY
ncbi:MAG: 3-deoxy-D-manno-octulosonic acid transferase [Crocinitomicaceae bacterium]|nr:3-deoxy-D-manno-octulosonic acid transferase [Crocinitomicaceae bacterium]